MLTGCQGGAGDGRRGRRVRQARRDRTGVNAPTFQFMRAGYFCLDNRDCTAEHLVFNRSVSLKDSFKKFKRQRASPAEPEALFFYPNHPFFRWGGGGRLALLEGLVDEDDVVAELLNAVPRDITILSAAEQPEEPARPERR